MNGTTDAAAEVAQIFSAAAGACGRLGELSDPEGGWRRLIVDNVSGVEGLDGSGVVTAIIDTGLTREHPQLSSAVIDQVDLTGQGIGDRCGHGTVVALLLMNAAPGQKLVDVKALGDDGRSSPATLVAALEWVGSRGGVASVNMSAGVYRPWCNGDCDLCAAADALSAQRVVITAAAGNRAGITACPAKAEGVISVTVVDEWGQLMPGAGNAGEDGFAMPQPQGRLEDA